MQIRSACVNDAEALLSIYSYYVENTAVSLELTVPTVKEFRDRISNTLNRYPYLVAEDGNGIAGFCYASEFRVREGYRFSVETSVYVKNGLQKNGYGRMLVDALTEELKKIGIRNINVCIVSSEDKDDYVTDNSLNFHKKLGFSTVGRFHKCAYKFNRWYDVVWMEKHIGEHN